MQELPGQLVELIRSQDEDLVHEYGLVVLSQRSPYWVVEEGNAFLLLVPAKREEELRRQLELYDAESVNWPPVEPSMVETGASGLHWIAWMILLFIANGFSLRWPELREFGKLSSEEVMHGDLYRCLTALFLHADLGHLAGNMLFGAVFLHLVARQVGGWLAWISILLAGTCGNFLNAWVYYPAAHYSIGASTAVFGAIGILVSLPAGFLLRHTRKPLVRTWGMPFVIGLVFLAWFGTGSEQTDTSAHLMGFVSGVPLGVLAGWIAGRGSGFSS
ncbi:MAG: rhomboid family intramembrane serine protease [Oceanipulchritudo sp.]|jgi:membrane associated rhomboid family serine protease